jgi:hypothetical protein
MHGCFWCTGSEFSPFKFICKSVCSLNRIRALGV